MLIEWCLLGALGCVSFFLIRRACRGFVLGFLPLAIGVLLVLAGISWGRYIQKAEITRKEFRVRLPHSQTNEYVSSANCRTCHPNQYASWHRSYHRTMTQIASPQTVRANFSNVVMRFDGDDYRLERRGDQFWVEMVDPDWKLVMALKKHAFETGRSKVPPIEPEHRPKV